MVVYVTGAILALIGGYRGLSPDRTVHTNADWVFVIVCFVLTSLFPLGAMTYSRWIGVETFRRPSLDRSPLGWWRDTLQPLRVSVVFVALTFIGSCFALPHADHRGVMLVWSFGAVSLGLFIGERLVYHIYRERIA